MTAMLIVSAGALTACQSSDLVETAELAPTDDSPIFSESEFGVPASPRVTNLRKVRKGGGREQVGKPYKVRGEWYYPKDQPGYSARGKASWYGANFHGRLTANGEVYDMFGLSAAHKTFPLPSYAMVTNLANGNKVMVRVNDRGPYAHGREIDVSSVAAEVLGFKHDGVASVKVDYVGRAPLEGDDTKMLMASFRRGEGERGTVGTPDPVMVASIERAARTPAGREVASAYAELPGVAPGGIPIPSAAERPIAPDGRGQAPSNLSLAASLVSSYAAPGQGQGAAAALAAIGGSGSGSAASAAGETIAIGLVTDPGLRERVRAIALGRGTLQEEPFDGGGELLTLVLRTGVAADPVLGMLWQSGADNAFVLRD